MDVKRLPWPIVDAGERLAVVALLAVENGRIECEVDEATLAARNQSRTDSDVSNLAVDDPPGCSVGLHPSAPLGDIRIWPLPLTQTVARLTVDSKGCVTAMRWHESRCPSVERSLIEVR